MAVVVTTTQCCCKWFFQHQHKLKQAIRACSLKVKEAYGGYEEVRPEEQEDPDYSFRYDDLTTTVATRNQRKKIPEDVDSLKFGQVFTDHMLKIFYNRKIGGWQKPAVIPFENISLHPAAKVLQYAVELFEGLKAYKGVDGRIRMFRPDLNMRRMNKSAESSGLPTFDGHELLKCLAHLIRVDREWVPHSEVSSLYIRPTLIGIDGTLGVVKSDSALLYTILSPVGDYFGGKCDSMSLYADPSYTRAWPGGCGDRKMGSNYGPTIRVQNIAAKRGRHLTLWLYGEDHQLTEAGTMNIFMLYIDSHGDKVLITPPLNGLILPGVLRQSTLELSLQWGEFKVKEGTFTMYDVIELLKQDRLLEIFGTGTAGIVCPVSSIEYLGQLIELPTMEHPNPVYKRVKDKLAAIQYGQIDHPWATIIE